MSHQVHIDTDAVMWRDAPTGRVGSPLLVLLHGYGSFEADLFSLAPALPEHLTIAALRAPINLPVDPFQPRDGYSWFDLLAESPDRAQIDAAVDAVIAWLDDLPEDFTEIHLLGFSQGGAMALQLARTQPERFASLVQLSGFVHPIPHEGDAALLERRPRIPAFQAWGSYDPVIPSERTGATQTWMAEHLDTEAHEYPMPHAVIPEEVSDIVTFLSRVSSDAREAHEVSSTASDGNAPTAPRR